MGNELLICYIRAARRKARAAATKEMLNLLRDLGVMAPAGGPLAEREGVFWITLPAESLERAMLQFERLGYTYAIDRLEPVVEQHSSFDRPQSGHAPVVRWRKKTYRLERMYEEDAEAMRERAPDRRTFLLEARSGEVREVRGYRGDGQASSRRGLPVCDARLLVNLVIAGEGTRLLDPFAGAGGIVIEALASGCVVTSCDRDPALQAGLSHLGAEHYVADASRLPFAEGTFDAIATEPPYHEGTEAMMIEALREMWRVLRVSGRMALLCTPGQADALRKEGAALELSWYLDSPINRKGLDVVVLAGRKGDR